MVPGALVSSAGLDGRGGKKPLIPLKQPVWSSGHWGVCPLFFAIVFNSFLAKSGSFALGELKGLLVLQGMTQNLNTAALLSIKVLYLPGHTEYKDNFDS